MYTCIWLVYILVVFMCVCVCVGGGSIHSKFHVLEATLALKVGGLGTW